MISASCRYFFAPILWPGPRTRNAYEGAPWATIKLETAVSPATKMTNAFIVLGCKAILSEKTTKHPDRFFLKNKTKKTLPAWAPLTKQPANKKAKKKKKKKILTRIIKQWERLPSAPKLRLITQYLRWWIMMAWIKGAAGAAHDRGWRCVDTCRWMRLILMLPLHWQRLLSVFEPSEQSDFSFPHKTQHQRVWGFFSSLLRIFSISYVSGPRDVNSAAVVALRMVQKLCAVSVLFSFTFFKPGFHRMRVRLRCVCAPSGVVGDSHQLHLECCMVLDAGVAYQPDTRMFKLASVQKHPN